MNLIERAVSGVKSWLGYTVPYDSSIAYGGSGGPRYVPSERQAVEASSIIGACLVSIQDAFCEARIASALTNKAGDDEYDHASPFALMMQRPDPMRKTNGRRTMRAAVADYEVSGNAYFDLVFDTLGYVREMVWVPHWCVKPCPDKNGLLDHYEVRMADGSTQDRKPHEMLHVANGIDSKNRLTGCSPLRRFLSLILTDNEIDVYCAEIVANPAIVGWSVMPKEEIDSADADLVERKITQKFGRGGRGGVLVPHFPSEIAALGFSPKDLDIAALRLTPEARISGVMNVPAIVAGLEVGLQRSTFKNTEEARKYFYRVKMSQLWAIFAEEFSVQVLPQCEGYKPGQEAKYDLRRVRDLQEDQDALHARARDDFQANLIKRSEGRSMIGFAVGDGDNVYYSDVAPLAPAATNDQVKARLAERRRAVAALDAANADPQPR